MKSVRFVCLFAIFVSILVLARSNRAQLVNLPNGRTVGGPRAASRPNSRTVLTKSCVSSARSTNGRAGIRESASYILIRQVLISR
jgi:hypothetical protein